MTPHELLTLAADDLAAANRVWAEGRNDPNALGEIAMRIQIAQAQAILAVGELLHEHFHYHDNSATQTPQSGAEVPPEFVEKVVPRVHGEPIVLEDH